MKGVGQGIDNVALQGRWPRSANVLSGLTDAPGGKSEETQDQ